MKALRCLSPTRLTANVGTLLAALAILLGGSWISAQTYLKGQSVDPAYEGWEQNPDGSLNLVFGYLNRNWEEQIDVPVGPDNNIEPGGEDQGQPTHFYPRRNLFVFRVRVPEDWGEKELVWTLTTKGETYKAYATLRPDYFINDLTLTSEAGAIGGAVSFPNDEIRRNTPPVLEVDGEHRVAVGQPLTLTAWVSDDGLPKPRDRQTRRRGGDEYRAYIPPRQVTPNSATGLRFSWFVYRGAGQVTFDPPQIKVWQDTRAGANSPWAARWVTPPAPPEGKWVVQATFQEPGTYVLRGRAHDGALWADEDVTVTVTR